LPCDAAYQQLQTLLKATLCGVASPPQGTLLVILLSVCKGFTVKDKTLGLCPKPYSLVNKVGENFTESQQEPLLLPPQRLLF
jgi:hypothetical protein